MTDVWRLTPRFQWRGIPYPLIARSVSFQHENIPHRIQYRDNDFPEPIGPHSFLFSYGIPMREDIAKGPYKNLFNEGLTQLVRDCRNREPGPLIDPVYGEFRCVPVSFSDETDVNRRDGTDIRVEFLHSPLFNEGEPALVDNITGIQGLVSDAGALEEQVQTADWNQEPSPEGMTDVLSAINGIGRQGLRQVDKIAAALDDLAFRAKKIEETADLAENPQNWRIRDSARNARDTALRLKERITEDPTRKVAHVITHVAKTVAETAAESGMTVQDLLRLNPEIRGPVIRPGFKLRLFRVAA